MVTAHSPAQSAPGTRCNALIVAKYRKTFMESVFWDAKNTCVGNAQVIGELRLRILRLRTLGSKGIGFGNPGTKEFWHLKPWLHILSPTTLTPKTFDTRTPWRQKPWRRLRIQALPNAKISHYRVDRLTTEPPLAPYRRLAQQLWGANPTCVP